MRENRTPVPSLARSDSTTELPPHDSTERAAGIEPASTVWKTVALPLDDARLNWFQSISHSPSSCSRELHSPSPAYQAGAPLTGPEQQLVERRGVEPRSLPCESSVLPVELSSHSDRQRVSWDFPQAGVSPPVARGFEPRYSDDESMCLPLTQHLRPAGAPEEDRTPLA